MKSMTGFASYKIESDFIKASLSIKSVNSRFLDLTIQLPAYLAAIEQKFRAFISDKIARGKIDLNVRVYSTKLPSEVIIDSSSAKAISDALKQLNRIVGIKGQLTLSHLLGFDGIITYERSIDSDALWEKFLPALEICVVNLNKERIREGLETRKDFESKLLILETNIEKIDKLSLEVEQKLKQNIRNKFEEVLGNILDENRIMTELASLLVKYSINEELVRLRSHITAFRLTMDEEVCGKKLDFICQEIHRETNTLGSKSADSVISMAVINMKDAIENIREQVRNIE